MERRLYIIAGCNGAGKTTASYTILPEIFQCKEFVNADEIARGLSPFNPESVAIEAGRLMLSRIEELLRRGESFSIETTLATKSYVNLVHRAQKAGYRVHLIFFWLESPELAMQRVAERVRNGGHGIPTATIKRRYVAGIRNLFQLYMGEVDYWSCFDNSKSPRLLIGSGGKGSKAMIANELLLKKMKGYVK
ncbi:MAG: zeta toxin family protein [Prevotella sp.]|nr:zeta toxin family protein [Prevotella sp.]